MKHDSIETRHERLRQELAKIAAADGDSDGYGKCRMSLVAIAVGALLEDEIASTTLLYQYQEGFCARHSGATQVHNPYSIGTAESASWHTGWMAAR